MKKLKEILCFMLVFYCMCFGMASVVAWLFAFDKHSDICVEPQYRRVEYVFPVRQVACWFSGVPK